VSFEKVWLEGYLKQRQKIQNLMFLSEMGYNKSNDRVRNPKVNAIFGSIPILTKEISNIKNGEPIPVNQSSDLVTQTIQSSNYFDTYLLTKTFLNDLSQFSLFATNNNNDD
tara:strand:- start:292 stop:624 length:333 start_codon:yes stop_codon:yes gene_type:complete